MKKRGWNLILLTAVVATLPCLAFYTTDFDLNEMQVQGAADGILQMLGEYYFEDLTDRRTCAVTSFGGMETGNEQNCKCKQFPGDTCLDIFVNSTARKTSGIGSGYEFPDYCLTNITVMEAFINGYYIDSIYYVPIDCPAGFHCLDGRCQSDAGITVQSSGIVVFDREGNIIEADQITINGVTLRDVRNATMSSILMNISSFRIGDTNFTSGRDMVPVSPDMFDASSVQAGGFLLGGVHGVRLSGVEIPMPGTLEKNLSRIIGRSDKGGSFSIESPIDDTLIIAEIPPGSTFDATLINGKLHISGKNLNMTVTRQGIKLITVQGEDAAVTIERLGSIMIYTVKKGTMQYVSGEAVETVRTESETRIELSYQLGFICADLSRIADYEYEHKTIKESSFAATNSYQDKYRLCLSKKQGQQHKEYNGLLDLHGHTGNLSGALKYYRYGKSKDLAYDSSGLSYAKLNLDHNNIATSLQVQGMALMYSGYFKIEENGRRLLSIRANPRQEKIRKLSTDACLADITFHDEYLEQSGDGRLVAFGPGTGELRKFEEALK
jgi:hypothetical protein